MSAEDKKDEEQERLPIDAAGAEVSTDIPAADSQKLRDEMLYMRAEFENTKRRILRDQEIAIRFSNEKIVAELLTVVDLFERALNSGNLLKEKATLDVGNLLTGIEMTHRELVHLLNRFGVELIGAEGDRFDPSRHEAVSQIPVDKDRQGTVVGVAQRGCLFQGRLLKPAKVVVGVSKENRD